MPTRTTPPAPPPSPVPPIRVIILGAPRSGTTSTGTALAILGFTPYIGIASAWERGDFAAWSAALAARATRPATDATDLHRILRGCDAVSGFAAAILAEDLIAAYPAASIVLTVREGGAWAESFAASIVRVYRRCAAGRWVWGLAGGGEREFARFVTTAMRAWGLREPFEEGAMRARYAAHNARVREVVKDRGEEGRMLEFDPRMGWEPLCAFLGKEVPDVQFPHTAGRESIGAMITRVWRTAVFRSVLKGGLGSAAVVILMLGTRSVGRGKLPLLEGTWRYFTGVLRLMRSTFQRWV